MKQIVSSGFLWMGEKMTNGRRAVSALLVAVLFIGLAGCTKEEKETSKKVTEEISIPMILTVDPTTGAKNEQRLVKAFNKAYRGTYHLDVEWVMETEEEYRKNLKRLNVTDELPAVITDLRMLPSFYRMMIEEGRIEDISDAVNSDPEWKNMIEPAVMEACTEEDGSIYLSPISTAAFSCSGVFWNQKLFEQAGIERFPETWEEFWKCCKKLKNAGVTPLGLHTEGTGWAAMLLATAELAATEEGEAFMKQLYPDSYQNESGIHLAESLQRLFQYTTEDALHTDFDVAYTNFVSEKVAMLPNGYWMIEKIPEEIKKDVRFSPFPKNELISSQETFGWAIVSGYSDEVKEGALAFFKFRTIFNQEEKVQLFKQDKEKVDRLLLDYLEAFEGNPQIVPNYQVKWNSILQEETLGECLPDLAQGKMTPEEFVQKADDSIRQYREEQ